MKLLIVTRMNALKKIFLEARVSQAEIIQKIRILIKLQKLQRNQLKKRKKSKFHSQESGGYYLLLTTPNHLQEVTNTKAKGKIV